MRTLALLLLLINMAFFAWQQQLLTWLPWQPEQFSPAPVEPYRSTLPQLVLLNEREAATRVPVAPIQAEIAPVSIKPKEAVAQVKAEPTTTLPVAPVAIPIAMPTPPETLPLQALESVPPSEKLHPFIAAKPSDTAATMPVSVTEQPAAAVEKISFKTLAMIMINTGQVTSPAPAPVVVSNTNSSAKSSQERGENLAIPAQTITREPSENSQAPAMKTEQTTVTTAHSDSKSEKQPPAPDVATDKTKTLLSVPTTKTNKTEVICYQIGVFLQPEAVNAAINWFKKKRVTATSQKGDTRLATTTWIYLPPVRSLQLAQTTQQQLKRLGVKDTEVITRAGANTISLGVYRDKLGVAQRLQELRSKGFNDVRTEEHYATETKYWLSVKIASNNTTLLSQFQKAFKGLQATTVTCK